MRLDCSSRKNSTSWAHEMPCRRIFGGSFSCWRAINFLSMIAVSSILPIEEGSRDPAKLE